MATNFQQSKTDIQQESNKGPVLNMKHLEQHVLNMKQYRLDLMKAISDCTILSIDGISRIIMEYCCLDDMILIPNTFEKDEFFKYWFVVEKGRRNVNGFRQFHEVKLQSDCVELIRRGAIASINRYIPSKNAKLILECKFIHQCKTDFMTFSTRSNGTRDPNVRYSYYGDPHYGGNKVQISWPPEKLQIHCIYNPMGKLINIEQPPIFKTLSLKVIDDGEHITYMYNDGSNAYLIESDAFEMHLHDHRVLVCNREQPNNVTEITYLQLSVLSNFE